MKFKNAFYLQSGRVFLLETISGFPIECTEMRDVHTAGKNSFEVRNTLDPHIIWKHLVPYESKWLLTVSTQKGCNFNCNFCDCPSLGFSGNLTEEEIEEQVRFILSASPYVTKCDKAKIGFARMGEPACNLSAVLNVIKKLPKISKDMGRDFRWLPCFNSILPRKIMDTNKNIIIDGYEVLNRVMEVKENNYDGFLHFQLSINSTDETVRRKLFGGANVLSLKEIVGFFNKVKVTNRTITLNFIVMKNVPVDVKYLIDLGLTKEKFVIKLIPLNSTIRSKLKKLETFANYETYDQLVKLGEKFKENGIPTVIDSIAKCEEAGLCCGQLAHIFAK